MSTSSRPDLFTRLGGHPTVRENIRRSRTASRAIRRPFALVLCFILAVIMLATTPAAVRAGPSAVIGGEALVPRAVGDLVWAGILRGREASSLVPQEYVTRGQLAVYLARALGLPDSSSGAYEDVIGTDPCFGAVGALHEVGIITGTMAATFSPDELVTRQDAVAWIMDALSWAISRRSQSSVPVRLPFFESTAGWLGGFRDRSLIDAAHTRAVANAYRLKIIDPTADGWFYPTLPLSRGDAAIMLDRAFLRSISARDTYPVAVPSADSYPPQTHESIGPLVWYMEHRLTALRYRPGPIDGVFDHRTRDAVMAFQKVEKLRRDGVAGEAFWRHITVAKTPTPMYAREGTRVEIDLRRQVLFMITDNQVWKIIHVSTGASGTHVGHFQIRTKYEGWVVCVTLSGRMYYPSYVVSRTAIHGYPEVPHYPASHGCIRVPMWMAVELFYETPLGMPVDIYYSR